ncbi:aldo/keto reductase [Micromonospora sp. NPDC047467]|uniref:aldo/keto reductase n=1 Tax=Micromonospora sp. NPDC047467 TaxID=3154814 RepID=UPI0033DC2235
MTPQRSECQCGRRDHRRYAAAGIFGPYYKRTPAPISSRELNLFVHQRTAVVDAVLAIAEDLGVSAAQVSLAWLRRRAALATTALVPIVGPRTLTQLDEYLKSLDLDLSDQHYQRLDEVSALRPGAPHEDVAAALDQGTDGDRTLLDLPPVPAI